MKCENIGLNTDMTHGVMTYHTFSPLGSSTQNAFHIMTSNRPSFQVDGFKQGIAETLKAINFFKFEQE